MTIYSLKQHAALDLATITRVFIWLSTLYRSYSFRVQNKAVFHDAVCIALCYGWHLYQTQSHCAYGTALSFSVDHASLFCPKAKE